MAKRQQFEINPEARREMWERSQGLCERCEAKEAVHAHHLTYKRAGHELPEDLQHICLGCHCLSHPYKADEILEWELQRRARIAGGVEVSNQETDEERTALDFDYDEEQLLSEIETEAQAMFFIEFQKQAQELARQEEYRRNEPAWNLGKYTASGYCLEDVEREEER